jgi:Tol biopolymer transport system component
MIRWFLAAAALVLAAVLAVPAVRHWREKAPIPPQPLRAAWVPGDALDVGAGTDYPFGLALSPDGRQLVYPAARAGAVGLWLQSLITNDTRALPATDGASSPFWSPDGTRIGFFAEGRIRAIDLANGSVTDLAGAPSGRGAAWNASGDLVFAPNGDGGLTRLGRDGRPNAFTTPDAAHGESSHRWPAFLSDGTHVVFFVRATERSRAGIWIAALDDPSSRRRLISSDGQAVVARNTLLYVNDVALMAQPLDPATWTTAGRSELAGLPVGRGPLDQLFATASPEVLIYGPPGTTRRELRWTARNGSTVGRLGDPLDAWGFRIAPDGNRVAITELDPQTRTLDVWIRKGSQPVPTRLSISTDADEGGAWSPDGNRVAWVAARRKVTIRGAGAVLPEHVVASYDPPVHVWDWSRDAGFLLIGRTAADTRDDLWILPLVDGLKEMPYAAAAFNQIHGVFAPNERAIAYASDESGQFDIYIDTFPKPGARIRVTTAGGTEPRWRGDGREIYFRRGSEIHAVAIGAQAGNLDIRSSERLFDAGVTIRSYDVSADGTRFLLNLPAISAAPRVATLVVNWHARATRE